MRKITVLLLTALLLMAMVACGAKDSKTAGIITGHTIGLSFPNAQQWAQDTALLSEKLNASGCTVVLEYAEDAPAKQSAQLQTMIQKPVDCLVIAAIDSIALTEVLQQAKNANIPVIAYDRLLTATDAVTHYVSFDHESAGKAVAQYIIDTKSLADAAKNGKRYTIEFFMGSPEDNSAVMFHRGIIKTLQSYLDSGVLVCKSGRTAFEDTCVQDADASLAQNYCSRYLTQYYTDSLPDIFCTAGDTIAAGCCKALEAINASGWPMITGQGVDAESIDRILAKKQAISVYKNTAILAAICEEAVRAALTGFTPQHESVTINNGSVDITAYLCLPAVIDSENCKQFQLANAQTP